MNLISVLNKFGSTGQYIILSTLRWPLIGQYSKYAFIRYQTYKTNNAWGLGVNDKDSGNRLTAKHEAGFEKEDVNDEDVFIRKLAYRKFGYTENAFKDSDANIRRVAYTELGFVEKALEDPHSRIRLDAAEHFDFPRTMINDDCDVIRIKTYFANDLLNIAIYDKKKYIREASLIFQKRQQEILKNMQSATDKEAEPTAMTMEDYVDFVKSYD